MKWKIRHDLVKPFKRSWPIGKNWCYCDKEEQMLGGWNMLAK